MEGGRGGRPVDDRKFWRGFGAKERGVLFLCVIEVELTGVCEASEERREASSFWSCVCSSWSVWISEGVRSV